MKLSPLLKGELLQRHECSVSLWWLQDVGEWEGTVSDVIYYLSFTVAGRQECSLILKVRVGAGCR